jgi:hypothetical protein
LSDVAFSSPRDGGEIYLSLGTTEILRERSKGCFLCKLILEDQEKHGKLTGYPFDFTKNGTFPIEAKVVHIKLERRSWENSRPPAPPGGVMA